MKSRRIVRTIPPLGLEATAFASRVPTIRQGGWLRHGGRSQNSDFLDEKHSKAAILYQDEHDKRGHERSYGEDSRHR
jgi:hypothetical protein